MTGLKNHSMEDPYDASWIRSVTRNPFGENVASPRITVSPDVSAMLRRIDVKLGIANKRASYDVLAESNDDIDIVIEEIAKASEIPIEELLVPQSLLAERLLSTDDEDSDDE
jgi:hypothetical protein